MSHRAANWARQVRGISGTQKLVLFMLAEMANSQGEAWPAVESLAADCCLSVRAVQNALRDLAQAELITIHRGGGRQTTSIYRLAVPATELDTETPQDVRGFGAQTQGTKMGNQTGYPVLEPEVRAFGRETPQRVRGLQPETPHLIPKTPHEVRPNLSSTYSSSGKSVSLVGGSAQEGKTQEPKPEPSEDLYLTVLAVAGLTDRYGQRGRDTVQSWFRDGCNQSEILLGIANAAHRRGYRADSVATLQHFTREVLDCSGRCRVDDDGLRRWNR